MRYAIAAVLLLALSVPLSGQEIVTDRDHLDIATGDTTTMMMYQGNRFTRRRIRDVDWQSSDSTIVDLSPMLDSRDRLMGNIARGVSVGSATITGQYGSKADTIVINVIGDHNPPVDTLPTPVEPNLVITRREVHINHVHYHADFDGVYDWSTVSLGNDSSGVAYADSVSDVSLERQMLNSSAIFNLLLNGEVVDSDTFSIPGMDTLPEPPPEDTLPTPVDSIIDHLEITDVVGNLGPFNIQLGDSLQLCARAYNAADSVLMDSCNSQLTPSQGSQMYQTLLAMYGHLIREEEWQ